MQHSPGDSLRNMHLDFQFLEMWIQEKKRVLALLQEITIAFPYFSHLVIFKKDIILFIDINVEIVI